MPKNVVKVIGSSRGRSSGGKAEVVKKASLTPRNEPKSWKSVLSTSKISRCGRLWSNSPDASVFGRLIEALNDQYNKHCELQANLLDSEDRVRSLGEELALVKEQYASLKKGSYHSSGLLMESMGPKILQKYRELSFKRKAVEESLNNCKQTVRDSKEKFEQAKENLTEHQDIFFGGLQPGRLCTATTFKVEPRKIHFKLKFSEVEEKFFMPTTKFTSTGLPIPDTSTDFKV